MALVSMIVPFYKVEEYFEKCIKSILNQFFRDFEIILVDDGSTDNSGQMCDELFFHSVSKGIPIYVIHQTNKGLSGARNTGIDWSMLCSDSEWICFVDSDDTISELFVEKLLDAAVSNDADLVVCDFMIVNTEGVDVQKNPHVFPLGTIEDKKEIFEILLENWRIRPTWNKIYRKRLFEELRFDVGKFHEDEFIIHKMLFFSNKVVFLPETLYLYFKRSTGIMGNRNRKTNRDLYLAIFNRYWFCKEKDLPTADGIVCLDFMIDVVNFHDKTVLSEYRKIFFDYPPNKTLKRVLQFQFGFLYSRYRKNRLR